MNNHDWTQADLDYESATVLNEIDQKKHEAELMALYGTKE